MPRYSIVGCETCKKENKVGEKDSPTEVFEILHVIDSTGEDFWFCRIECLREWANKYLSPYSERESEPLDAILPEELN
jgi:hypothetical protein